MGRLLLMLEQSDPFRTVQKNIGKCNGEGSLPSGPGSKRHRHFCEYTSLGTLLRNECLDSSYAYI